MSQLKHLLEKATQKNEMKWRVYAYDPAKDNKLVHTSELFDDINGAGIEKAEWLKKHPEHTIEIIAEAAQKNEDRQEYFRFRLQTDDERKRVKALDRLSNIKEKNGYYYVTFLTKTNSAGELAEYLRANKIYPVDLLGVTDYTNESADIDVKNPGVLEVPDGKKVDELPQSHFEKLVDKKGYAEVIRALTNLEVWNKDKNKSLSSWASNMADKLKKKFRPESAQKNEVTFKPGDKVSVKSYDKTGNQFVTLRNATIIKEISEKEAGQLDPAYNLKEPTGMKHYLVKLNTGSKKAVLANDLILESAQKNEALTDLASLERKHIYTVKTPLMIYNLTEDIKDITDKEFTKFQAKGWLEKDRNDILVVLPKGTKLRYEMSVSGKYFFTELSTGIDFGLELDHSDARTFLQESVQVNETRGYTVTVELGVPDNMNNRDIEDEVERLLRTSNKINVVMDVTAERK